MRLTPDAMQADEISSSPASTLLAYTENYHQGGGNRYLVDTVNALAPCFGRVVIAANPGGLFHDDLARLKAAAETETVGVVTVSAAYESRRHGRFSRALLVNLARLTEPLLFALNTLTCLRLIARLRPTLVFAHNGGYPAARSTLAMVVASRMRGVPAVLSIVSVPTRRKSWARVYERAVDRLVWRSARVVANTGVIAKALEEVRDLPRSEAMVLWNGVEDTPDRSDAGASGEAVVVGCVSRLDRLKGALQLYEAFASLAPRRPETRLLLVGDGDARDELLARAERDGLRERIDAPGAVFVGTAPIIAGIDIYAFPSLYEGFPYAILEAMRAGCAIVSTDVGGIREAMTDGVEGLLVPPGSSAALAEAIERLLGDADLRATLGRAARERYAAQFTLEGARERTRTAFAAAGLLPSDACETGGVES